MKIQEFLANHPEITFDSASFWAKKFSEIHLPPTDSFSGKTPCGTPMLGNNYASVAYHENREICPACVATVEGKTKPEKPRVKL